jgi:maltose O-acetyltransferase
MTEKEKMLNGVDYIANDATLIKEREYAKSLCMEFNNTINKDDRSNIIKKLFNKVGDNIWMEPTFFCDYGYNISVGDNFYANHNLVMLDVCKITIGNNVFIGPNVGIYTAGHPIDVTTRNSGLESGRGITIGDNVWLGGNVVILPGVTIGSDTVIGAGSVVTRDIPSNVVAVGNPCHVLKDIN